MWYKPIRSGTACQTLDTIARPLYASVSHQVGLPARSEPMEQLAEHAPGSLGDAVARPQAVGESRAPYQHVSVGFLFGSTRAIVTITPGYGGYGIEPSTFLEFARSVFKPKANMDRP